MILLVKEFKKWEYLFKALADKYKKILKIGVGNRCAVDKQYLSYHSAILTIKSMSVYENFALFDNLDLDILLNSIPQNVKETYLQKTIISLSQEDKKLIKTYYENDMSLKDTSESLFIHKNTLQYKLDKIEEKCGYNPRSFRKGVILYLALKLLQE
jgi:carbohydrate diacid regulator